MSKIAHILLFALVVCISGCDTGLAGASLVTDASGAKVVLITDSPGGDVEAFDRAFRRWSRIPGVRVEIRHWCASACTQVLGYFIPEQICLSPGARIGFHAASMRRIEFSNSGVPSIATASSGVDSVSTVLLFAQYPGWIQYQLASAGIMGPAAGNPLATISAEEFWERGYRVCPNTMQTAGDHGAPDVPGG